MFKYKYFDYPVSMNGVYYMYTYVVKISHCRIMK